MPLGPYGARVPTRHRRLVRSKSSVTVLGNIGRSLPYAGSFAGLGGHIWIPGCVRDGPRRVCDVLPMILAANGQALFMALLKRVRAFYGVRALAWHVLNLGALSEQRICASGVERCGS